MQRVAQIAFCIALISLALIGLTHQDFCIITLPNLVTKWRSLFTYGNLLVIVGCILVIIKRYAFTGSLICAATIFLFSYLFKIVPEFTNMNLLGIINSPDGWETLALGGGCLILASSLKKNNLLFYLGLVTQSVWFLWAGIGHFEYVKYVESLIPGYIPFHLFWTYFCAVCLILASIGLWITSLRMPAAKYSAIMFFLWCIMLHIPNYISHQADITRLMGIFESLAFAAIMGIVYYEFKRKYQV